MIGKLFTMLTLAAACAVSADRGTYSNPIIKGDWSDPALIRVGSDYYSLRSTFGWQPGLFIAHSKDLLHWEYAGYVYLSHPAIEPGDTGGGCWGAEMGYDPNNHTYLAYAPIGGKLWAFASKSPGGPYSEGVDLGLGGIDPGFFADDDGKLYLTWASGKIVELARDGLSVVREVCNTGMGHGIGFEGPDVFKHGGWYYCLYSTGGTRPHQTSTVCTARARSIAGPWGNDPSNPTMQANFETDAVFQGPAHGTLVETPKGEWYVSYHAFEVTHYSLGRQMCLDPIEWTPDGWWRPVHGRIPSAQAKTPDLPAARCTVAHSDQFDKPDLGLQWFFHAKPDFSGQSWSLTERPGWLRIKTRPGDISSAGSLANVFLQRVDEKRFEFSTKVEFDAREGREAAGLHLYHDPGMNLWLVTTVRDDLKVFEVGKHSSGVRSTLRTAENQIGSLVYLKIAVDGNERATFFYSGDGRKWTKLGGEVYFGDSWQDLRGGVRGDPDLGWVGPERRNVWTATTMGVFAVQDGAGRTANADFDWFRVRGEGERKR